MIAFIAALALFTGDTVPSCRRAAEPTCPRLAIALERRLAERLGVGVGDTVSLWVEPGDPARRALVSAIYEPPTDPSNVSRRELSARLHLPDLATLLGEPDRVDRFGIRLAAGVTPAEAAARLNQAAFGFRAYPSAEVASEASQTFVVVSRFHQAIAVISVVASAVFLLCIMLLKVEERRRDAAVMRLIGIRRRTVFGALLIEAILVAAVGSVVGAVLALAAGTVVNGYYQHYFDTTLRFSVITAGDLWFSGLLSLGLGLAAGAVSAWRLAREKPLTLWGR